MAERVLTLGPACAGPGLRGEVIATATRLRLNLGHLDVAALAAELTQLATHFAGTGRTLPVLLDLQGAKCRLGELSAPGPCPERVELVAAATSTDPGRLPVPHPDLLAACRPGDRLLLNDRRVELQVETCPTAERVLARRRRPGELGSRKGIEIAGRPLPLQAVTATDRAAIACSLDFPFVDFALSFVHAASEADLLRPLLAGRRLIAKLERRAALTALFAIDRTFDETWLCRGDLGAEVGWTGLGPCQAEVVAALPRLLHPCLLAGEVLGAMITQSQPSRSEMVHLHDALAAGFAGIVLSDETARGGQVANVLAFLREYFALPVGPAGPVRPSA